MSDFTISAGVGHRGLPLPVRAEFFVFKLDTAQVAWEVDYQNSQGNEGKVAGQEGQIADGAPVGVVVGTPMAEPEYAPNPAAEKDQQNM